MLIDSHRMHSQLQESLWCDNWRVSMVNECIHTRESKRDNHMATASQLSDTLSKLMENSLFELSNQLFLRNKSILIRAFRLNEELLWGANNFYLKLSDWIPAIIFPL